MTVEERQKIWFLLVISFLVYVVAGLFGYGNDSDTYRMIISGQTFITQFKYDPSRYPSYLIPELAIGITSLIGSFYLSNLVSAILGSATLLLFFLLLRKAFKITDSFLITLTVGLNPYFIIVSSSSMDYIYSLFFIMAGIFALYRQKHIVAGALFSFAISSRLSNIAVVIGTYLYFLGISGKNEKKDAKQFLLSGFFALILSIFLYLPAFIAANYSFGFLTYVIGNWTFSGYASRFIYKNIYLFGLLPFLFFLLTTIYFFCIQRVEIFRRPVVIAGLIILLLQELLFFKIPLDKCYLLPILFVVIPIWAVFINSQRLLVVLLIFTISYNFINLDILNIKYNEELKRRTGNVEAIGANIGLFIKRGILIDDLMKRNESEQECKMILKLENSRL